MCFYSFQFGKLRETASQENVKRSLLTSNNMPSRTKSLLAVFSTILLRQTQLSATYGV